MKMRMRMSRDTHRYVCAGIFTLGAMIAFVGNLQTYPHFVTGNSPIVMFANEYGTFLFFGGALIMLGSYLMYRRR